MTCKLEIDPWPSEPITRLLAIDTGETHNGVVIVDPSSTPPRFVRSWNDITQDEVYEIAKNGYGCDWLAVERIESRGMAVGQATLDTAELVGIVRATFGIDKATRIFRRTVKLELCGSSRAKDANVSQAIRDEYPSTGGGKKPQIGTKGQPGPLYGLAKHAWSAMAVALAWQNLRSQRVGNEPEIGKSFFVGQ